MPEAELRAVRGKCIGILFQEPPASMNPVRKCGKQVFDVLPDELRKDGLLARRRVVELLALVGLEEPERAAEAYPHELSGGMIQRVALAAALAGEPSILIADEPTTALDPVASVQILKTLSHLKQELGLSLIIVSHDLEMISSCADHLLVMYAGRVVELGKAQQLLSTPTHPYMRALIDATESYARPGPPTPIPGEPPPVTDQPSGCRFHPRCQHADETCRAVEPPAERASHGGSVRCYHPLS